MDIHKPLMNEKAGMLKFLIIAILLVMPFIVLAACNSSGAAIDTDAIRVFTREEGSGTRDAFFELIGMPAEATGSAIAPTAATTAGTRAIDDEFADNPLNLGSGTRDDIAGLLANSAGNTDRVLGHATVAGGTGAIINSVAANPLAVGYISLGALRDDVRALPVDGVAPSIDAVIDGSYPLFRNFYIAVPTRVNTLAQDFLEYILSAEGQGIISGRGYVAPIQNPMSYSGRGMSGTLQISGSTSVAPVMRDIADAYMALHGAQNVTITILSTGSGAGIAAAREGSVDFGMSSRSISATELNELRDSVIIAHDGIAVIVHPSNTVSSVSLDDIRRIFTGELVRWDAVGAPPSAPIGAIRIFTREQDSGTRSAFVEMTGVEQDGADRTSGNAILASGTGAMNNAVAGNPLGIGYISFGAIRGDVRALPVHGVTPSATTVMNGAYPLSRNFYLAVPAQISVLAQDFIDFILSAAGQEIISGLGYVSPAQSPHRYTGSGMSGAISIEGSTSIAPVMRALADTYMALHGTSNVSIEIRATGSSAGITAAMEGSADIGMSSRSIRGAELAELNEAVVIAYDGIAIIVHPSNGLASISVDNIRRIFTGETVRWEDIG